MQIISDPQILRAQCRAWRKANESIALVPTMGYYHAGHEALMAKGRGLGQRLVVSLFVNPAQFGPNEDLAAYPRNLERDSAIAASYGADILFAPAPDAMYAPDHATWVTVPEMAEVLCGKSRPIHFRGVCTVVLKLFMLTGAEVAIFGQKDWQQQAILQRMARDLNLDTEIITIPTAREPDGLAMSSRNVYLTEDERQVAPHIQQALLMARNLVLTGEKNARRLREAVLSYWARTMPQARLDYLDIVHPESLQLVETVTDSALMACAIRLGKARLIDNILLTE